MATIESQIFCLQDQRASVAHNEDGFDDLYLRVCEYAQQFRKNAQRYFVQRVLI